MPSPQFWSKQTLREMMQQRFGNNWNRASIPFSQWDVDTCNEVGDWLYYILHPKEKDPRKDRPLPDVLKPIVANEWKR